MDERMKRACFACWLAGTLPFAAAAQPLGDPTRPPSVLDGASREEGPGPGEPRLQSVLLSPARKLAVIDGSAVPLGGRIGAATVVDISPSEVLLKDAQGTRVLKLNPAVEKRSRAAAGAGGTKP